MYIKPTTRTDRGGAKIGSFPVAAGDAGTGTVLNVIAYSYTDPRTGRRMFTWECELCGGEGTDTDDTSGQLTTSVQRQTLSGAKRHAEGCTL
ncbi:hypothetical protein [Kitasatospora purpeofusca]|uniref:hypothetical protein n=1 Tax=Kitasatospora purpeofusca TaxID=67352 RepID=UPI00224E492D|nr:hypothetical protein [Kitasatospora purpeofusca]MCX4752909.1 hypothetical protein [Kitasatospora purpeofusca]WSR32452.1 hypothetical protein OG715_16550 [Kitasatospora purpeofusca]WSR40540.1 hypothetical protein OG196_16335 [Kitasatospora purpeofusca]